MTSNLEYDGIIIASGIGTNGTALTANNLVIGATGTATNGGLRFSSGYLQIYSDSQWNNIDTTVNYFSLLLGVIEAAATYPVGSASGFQSNTYTTHGTTGATMNFVASQDSIGYAKYYAALADGSYLAENIGKSTTYSASNGYHYSSTGGASYGYAGIIENGIYADCINYTPNGARFPHGIYLNNISSITGNNDFVFTATDAGTLTFTDNTGTGSIAKFYAASTVAGTIGIEVGVSSADKSAFVHNLTLGASEIYHGTTLLYSGTATATTFRNASSTLLNLASDISNINSVLYVNGPDTTDVLFGVYNGFDMSTGNGTARMTLGSDVFNTLEYLYTGTNQYHSYSFIRPWTNSTVGGGLIFNHYSNDLGSSWATYAQFTTNWVELMSGVRLQLNSDLAFKPGGGTWSDTSDIALKDNIMDIDQTKAITFINELRPVKYNFKQKYRESKYPLLGFVAQDFEKAQKETFSEIEPAVKENFTMQNNPDFKDTYKTLNTSMLIPLSIVNLQMLNDTVEKLSSALDEAQKKIAILENIIIKIKK